MVAHSAFLARGKMAGILPCLIMVLVVSPAPSAALRLFRPSQFNAEQRSGSGASTRVSGSGAIAFSEYSNWSSIESGTTIATRKSSSMLQDRGRLQAAFDNECILQHELQPPTPNAPATFLADCPAWVMRTTDLVWNKKLDVNASLEEFFHPDFASHSSFGIANIGMQSLKDAVATTQTAFPDLNIHISDVYCIGNDIDGYKTVMPDALTGTNTGPSPYGPPTNKSVSYSGLAITYVNWYQGRWVYMAEWVLHDELSLVKQLGLDLNAIPLPESCSMPNPGCGINQPSWGATSPAIRQEQGGKKGADQNLWPPRPSFKPPHGAAYPLDDFVQEWPLSKRLIKGMDAIISNHIAWDDWKQWSTDMAPFWIEDLIYDTNWTPDPSILNVHHGLWEWYNSEHIPFNRAFSNCTFSQMIFAGEELTATTTTYANTYWQADWVGIPASHRPVRVRICDFYRINPDLRAISYNWMLIDMADLMLQAGFRVLPKPALPEGWVRPPNAMDGIPAPISTWVNRGNGPKAKAVVKQVLRRDLGQDGDRAAAYDGGSCTPGWATGMVWYGPVGFGMATGCNEYQQHFLQPLQKAFEGRKLELDVITCEGSYCGAHGRMYGNHVDMWLGQEATGKRLSLRFGMHFHVNIDTQEIEESWAIFDIPDIFNQMGINLYDLTSASQSSAAPGTDVM